MAIRVWEEMIDLYKDNMADIKKKHRITWFLRKAYWRNEKKFHSGFTALIKRRIQLQTALKSQQS